MMRSTIRPAARLCGLLLTVLAAAAAGAEPLRAPLPAAEGAALEPGLAVDYYYGYYRWIDELEERIGEGDAEPGAPLPALDYQTGTGKVLSSPRSNGVGARIRGYLHLAEPGAYTLVVQSNDGVRLTLAGERLIEDPDVHADRYSRPVTVEVAEPGWYPLEVLYFERKNTSTLRLFWRPPSAPADADMSLVPATVFAHRR